LFRLGDEFESLALPGAQFARFDDGPALGFAFDDGGSLGSYFGLAKNFSACAFLAFAAAVCRSRKLFALKKTLHSV